jgi:hypothetical protein
MRGLNFDSELVSGFPTKGILKVVVERDIFAYLFLLFGLFVIKNAIRSDDKVSHFPLQALAGATKINIPSA